MSAVRLSLVLPLAALAASCMTSSEGEALRKDVELLKQQLSADIKKLNQERVKLQKIMEQATSLLTRSSADVGAQVDRLQAKVDRFAGLLDERQKKLDELVQKFHDLQAKVDVKLESVGKDPPVPANKEDLFKQAEAKLNAGDQQEARRLLRHFISRNANDARADKAQLMLGDSWYAEQKFAQAILEYKKIIEQYKTSPYLPDALAKSGMAWYQMKFCAEAEPFFKQLLKSHKNHPQAASAKRVLKLIQRYRKNRDVCRPG